MVLQVGDLRSPVLAIRAAVPADLLVHRPHVLVEVPAPLRSVPAGAALQGLSAGRRGARRRRRDGGGGRGGGSVEDFFDGLVGRWGGSESGSWDMMGGCGLLLKYF
eukprot:CAMPEP_0184727512 /NCGR_PEP_ID=MMETSP0314-20130426/36733_1 /TAXON_ID=38298 /ORGANISM="Rhodella maculata, Strain CCMP 736" /LENGTH=105 /DNA_ID=CAMNT_0027193125 /DNA_START=118 /DNA_END=435 /DNA_ORIENTATION=+